MFGEIFQQQRKKEKGKKKKKETTFLGYDLNNQKNETHLRNNKKVFFSS
jgi:hypothetical protein